MAKVLSSISGNLISAASAGYAPTNSGDVSAIASAYQVVSATATQLYAGTAHVTSINGDPISASRAGNAANASLATSAYYDGTGRLISSLPDAATVSAIASSYADDKLDKTAEVVTATAGDGTYVTSINGMGISGQGGGGGIDSATCSAIASSYAESAASSKLDTSAQVVTATAGDGTYVTSINGMGLSGQGGGGGGGGAAFPAEINYGGNVRAVVTTGFQDATATRPTLFISSNPAYNSYPRMMLSENHATTGKSGAFLADAFEFYTGTGVKVFRADPTSVSGANFSLTKGLVNGLNWSLRSSYVTGGNNTSNWLLNKDLVSGMAGTATWEYGTAEYNKLTSVHDTVSANSASWGGGGGGVDSATVSAIASAYGHSALSSIYAGPGVSYGGADDPMIGINYDGAGPLGTDDNNVLICKTDGTTIGVNAAGELVSLVGGGVDSATVSAIASSYAESAASSKLDTSAQVVTSTASAYDMDSYAWTTEINGLEISAAKAYSASYATTAETAYSADFASSSDKAIYDANGRFLSSFVDSSYVDSAVSSKADSSALSSYALSSDVSSTIDTVSNNSASWGAGVSLPITGTDGDQDMTLDEYGLHISVPDGGYASNSADYGTYMEVGHTADYEKTYVGANVIEFTNDTDAFTSFNYSSVQNWDSVYNTVSTGSGSWTGGGGAQVVTATGSASATGGNIWFPITSYFVSSINGSSILPYGFSSLSGNSANWTSTNSAVSSHSAEWNSAYSLISGVTALLDSI